ncbi:MAG: hypothetical protein K5668_01120, partial [Lachnospiraceae bacterium]|nr:hypothetical protein [Lachnospiraceae bacterium]
MKFLLTGRRKSDRKEMMKKSKFIKITLICLALAAISGSVAYAMNIGEYYSTARVTLSEISGRVKETGKIHGAEEKVYYASVTAPIDAVYVKAGDRVDKGEVIVEYDGSDFERLLTEARIRSEQA